MGVFETDEIEALVAAGARFDRAYVMLGRYISLRTLLCQ